MTYLDHYAPPREGQWGWRIAHSWADFTAKRLDWNYGEGRAETPQARADLGSWNRLGRPLPQEAA